MNAPTTKLGFALRIVTAAFSSRLLLNWLTIRRSAIFHTPSYLGQLPDHEKSAATIWPIAHYLLLGEAQGRRPNPLFVTTYYRQQLQSAGITGQQPLLHYLQSGFLTSLQPNPVFMSTYYASRYEDFARSGQNPLAHYFHHGWREGRDPSPYFDTASFISKNPGIKNSGEIPMVHYLAQELSEPTELWGLAHGESINSALLEKPNTKKQDRAGTIDIIVPVYRRPDLVQDLFESMMASSDWDRVQRCLIVDDRGDSFTSEYLKTLPALDPRIKVLVNESNMGFLRSCNRAFPETNSDIVVLVNSDVQVPGGWLTRLVQPIEKDPKVALSTPLATSGANLSVALRPGQTWVEADNILAAEPPKYPDACTAIGYAMAIRRTAIGNKPLFDDIFCHGYGEDTDLHYRLITSGWRSVVCDNLLVFHKGSASYILDDKKAAIYDANRKLFFSRWGELHGREHARFVSANALAYQLGPSTHTRKECLEQDIDVLFVAPTNAVKIGGVKVIFELAAFLAARGINAKVYCDRHTAPLMQHSHDRIMPIFLDDSLIRIIKSATVVIGTGVGTDTLAFKLADKLKSRLWWLVQGPECYFSSGERYTDFKRCLEKAERVICVSEYLHNLAVDFGIEKSVWVPLGPDPLVFYPRDVTRDPKSLVVQLIDTPDKGARFAVSFAEEARRRGLNVNFFGSGKLAAQLSPSLGVFHGSLDSDGIAKLFSSSSWYLDLSIMEGLGLLPLEAALCGCRPVLTRKGAPELIFSDPKSATFLDSHLDYKRGIEMILASGPLDTIQREALAERYNTRKAFSAFYQLLAHGIRSKTGP